MMERTFYKPKKDHRRNAYSRMEKSCNLCRKVFAYTGELNAHTIHVHVNEETWYWRFGERIWCL